MKKITVLVLMLIGFSTLSFAQRGERQKMNPEEVAQKRAEKMKEELKLSDEQYQKVLDLNKEQAAKRIEKREERRAELQAKREVLKNEREAYSSTLQSILTPEQYEQHKAKMEERKHNRDGRRPQRRKRG